MSARSPSPWPQLAGASGQDRQELRPPRPLVLPDALGATQGASAVFWLSPADPAASQPGPGASELPPPAGSRHRSAALRAALAGERGSTHGHQAALAGWRPPAGVQRPRASPRRPRPLPSTLVRVRTGLLQALSGATRAECFFMMSRPPAGAPPPIAYILRPAGARLSVRSRWPPARRSASGWPLRPCPRGCRPGSCRRAAHCGGRPSEHIFPGRAATPHTRPQPPAWRLLQTPTSRTSALPTPTPRAHLLRPPPWDAQPCSPGPPSRPCPG